MRVQSLVQSIVQSCHSISLLPACFDRLSRVTPAQTLEEERAQTATMRTRAEAAEARASTAERAQAELTTRLEREKAAAKSIEAAYDVVAEVAEDAKRREGEMRARAEAAEKALAGMTAKAERSEAAAKSMEAAYDVVAEGARSEGSIWTRT